MRFIHQVKKSQILAHLTEPAANFLYTLTQVYFLLNHCTELDMELQD